MSAQPFLVDSYAALTEDAVTHLLALSGGVPPLCWGRYIYADLTADIEVAAKYGIPLLLISPRSARVPGGHGDGAADGAADRARMEHWSGVAEAKGARVLLHVFLDVEMKPNLSAAYWSGWSAAFDGSELVPCVYMPNRNYWPASWAALEASVAAGARCGGTWVALYYQSADGSAVLRDESWTTRPKASDIVPYLAWQAIGNADHMRYDFSVPNPDALEWLAAPASQTGPEEVRRADASTGEIAASLIPDPA